MVDFESGEDRIHAVLTGREADVVRCLVAGWSTQESAAELLVTHETVRTHLRNLRRKTGSRNLHGIVSWVYRHRDCCVNRIVIREEP